MFFPLIQNSHIQDIFFAITANPEPFYNIFDFIMVGDGEELIKEVIDVLYKNRNLSKIKKLEKLLKFVLRLQCR